MKVRVLGIRISSLKSEGAEAIDSSDDLDRVSTVKSSYPEITESQVFSLGSSTKRDHWLDSKVLDLTMEEPVLRRQAGSSLARKHSVLSDGQYVWKTSQMHCIFLIQGAGDISAFEGVIEAVV